MRGVGEEDMRDIIGRLKAYEQTGLEPEEIERIRDAYGRGQTLRSESAERLGIIKDIKTARLHELAEEERAKGAVKKQCLIKRDEAIEAIKFALTHPDDGCKLCRHYYKCEGEACPHYQAGIGAVDEASGKEHPDFKWTCEDFDFGTCDALKDTPCNGCNLNTYSNFDWKGTR